MSDVIRIAPRSNFTALPNLTICDRRLSLRTLGLLVVVLSRPDGWDYSVSGLAAFCQIGRDAIRTSLKELEAAGYLSRRQLHGENGTFAGNEYTIRDVSPLTENPATVESEKNQPLPDLPLTVEPLPGNPTQSNTRLNNNPPISPQKGKRKAKVEPEGDWMPERFESFWGYYPHDYRGNKKKAKQAWNKLKPEGTVLRAMARALQRHMNGERWQSGIGIPNVSTFINPENGYWDLGDAKRTVKSVAGSSGSGTVVESRFEKL